MIEYGIASKMGGNIYVVIRTLVIIFPNLGKNRTTPYAPSAEIRIAMIVVLPATTTLFIIFVPNFSCSKTIL